MAITFDRVSPQNAAQGANAMTVIPPADWTVDPSLAILLLTTWGAGSIQTYTIASSTSTFLLLGETYDGVEDVSLHIYYVITTTGEDRTILVTPDLTVGVTGSMTSQLINYLGIDITTPFDGVSPVFETIASGLEWAYSLQAIAETDNAFGVTALTTLSDHNLGLKSGSEAGHTPRMSGEDYDTGVGGDASFGLSEKALPLRSVGFPTWLAGEPVDPTVALAVSFVIRASGELPPSTGKDYPKGGLVNIGKMIN